MILSMIYTKIKELTNETLSNPCLVVFIFLITFLHIACCRFLTGFYRNMHYFLFIYISTYLLLTENVLYRREVPFYYSFFFSSLTAYSDLESKILMNL